MKQIIERVKGLILKTRETWETITAEESSISLLFKDYVFITAAIPAAAAFLGKWLIGIRIPFAGIYRFSFGSALLYSLIGYVLTIAGIWALGMVISWLAPRFGGERDDVKGLKVAVFTYLPFLIAGVFQLISTLSALQLLVGLYCLYIMYVGLPIVMGTPKEKTVSYYLVTIVAFVVIYIIVGAITGGILKGFGPDIPPLY
jgi:hypothetical protein